MPEKTAKQSSSFNLFIQLTDIKRMRKRIPDEIINLTLAIEFLKQEKLRKH